MRFIQARNVHSAFVALASAVKTNVVASFPAHLFRSYSIFQKEKACPFQVLAQLGGNE